MAREYGKVLMSAWNDRDFTNLSRRAQGTYFFLCSQSDLNRAGVVTMALNRWASRCGENDRNVILEDLGELARARFIAVDEDEEEILVRSFIRNDEGWKSPNVMVAVASAARQISSETHRAVIADELARIDTSGLSMTISAKTGRSTREFIEIIIKQCRESLAWCEKNPSVTDWGTLTETLPVTLPNEAKTVTLPERVSSGFLTETKPETETESETEPETSPSEISEIETDGFDAFWDAYGKKVGRKNALTKYGIALKKPGVTPDLLLRAARAYIAWLEAEGKSGFTKDAATWLHGEHWDDERSVRESKPKLSTTDQRVRDNLAVVERLRQREQQETQTHLRAIGTTR